MKQLLIGILCLFGSLSASGQVTDSALVVNESLSRIQVTRDAITPILDIENHRAAGPAHVRVELVDPSDVVRASSEMDVRLHSGSNRIPVELRGWTQKSQEWNDSIWYRVRYRVSLPGSPSPAAEGILALSTKADGVFDLRVVASKWAIAGKPYRVRVYTQSLADLRPMSGVQVQAELESEDEGGKLKLTSTTDSHGYAQLEFNAPAQSWGTSASLKVVASKGQIVREADNDVDFGGHWRFFTNTDKPLYQPGQTVHVRALLLDAGKHALANTPVTVTIVDEDDTVAFRASAQTSRFGVVRADWEIPENLRLGDYMIEVKGGTDDTDDELGGQGIRISRYELPTFTVNVKPDRSYYLPGQNATVTASADYLFGKPVSKGHVKIARETERKWNFKEQRWDTQEAQKWEGDTDASGKFVAHVDLSKDQDDLGDDSRFRDLDFGAYYTDSSTGKTEQRRFRLRITRDPIHIYVIEEGNALGQLPLEFYVSSSYADGSPAQCEVAIHQGSEADDKPGALLRSVKTNKYGVARVRGVNVLPFKSAQQYGPSARLVLLAHDRDGRSGHETQDFWDPSNDFAIRVLTDHALYRPDEPIEVEINSSRKNESLLLDVLREGRVIRSQSVRLRGGHAYVILPYSSDFQGELAIAAYSPAESGSGSDLTIGTRTILYPHDPALKVSAKFDRPIYRPGEDAVLNLKVRGTDGRDVEAALGSVIFDQAVEERARTDEEFGRGQGYGFDESFRDYWYQPAALGSVKREDLDRLDVSQPFNDDLQLAAEVLLLNRWGVEPLVFGGADYPAGAANVFRDRFARELAPVKLALDNAYQKDLSYPHDRESLANLLKRQGVDFDAARDPWGSPFKATFSFKQSQELMELASSGPDKKPGTDDDVAALTVERPYFRPIGDAIDKTITDYHGRTGGYARDLLTFSTELAKAGVQWNSVRDPWGHPYRVQFGIIDTRFTVTIISAGPDGVFDSGASSDDFPVWTNYSDYFADATVKIDAALARHYATYQEFPQNEAEFYKILDDAKIPRDILKDAWGHPAWLLFDSRARYQDRVVMDYNDLVRSQETSANVVPETEQFAFVHLYSPGQDGIPHTSDDFELASFSREIARQNSAMTQPSATASAPPLSGGSGGITGVVIDQSGAVVEGTKVTAQLYDRIPFSTEADSSGRYTLRNLPTGSYAVRAEKPGFRAAVVTRVPVQSLSMTELNLTLMVGSVAETVEVQAAVISLQTESGEVSSVVSKPHTEAPGPIATPRLREFFPETLLWEPMLETDRQGNSRLHFKFADSITNWKLSLIASTVDGQIGLLDTEIKTFQPFFAELDPPQVLTQGDEVNLPVVLRNYLEKPQTLRVDMQTAPWFTLLSPASREVPVSAGESERASFRYRVIGTSGDVKQRVTAANREIGDAVEKSLRIHPDGEPRTVTAARLFKGNGDLDLEIPQYAIAGSEQVEIKLYPNLMSHVLESSSSLLERPYGCGEQTISSTYPNLMVLRLYKQAGKPPDSVYRTAFRFAQLGYSQLLSYQHDDGGISVWKQDKPDLALTAYAVSFLNDARDFVDVDPAVIASAEQFLLRGQTPNGSWEDKSSLTAYLTLTLAKRLKVAPDESRSADKAKPIKPALARAVEYLESNWSSSNDPYTLAQIALAAFQAGNEPLGAKTNVKLRTMIHHEGDSSYWAMETNTLFYEWGRAGRTETTALVVQALALEATALGEKDPASEDRTLVEQGLSFLIHEKDGYGAWYSGQTTINVLEALLLLGKPQANLPSGAAEVLVNGSRVGDLKLPGPNEISAPLLLDLTKFVKPGQNRISIVNAGTQTSSAQAVARFYIPWDRSSAKKDAGLRTGDSDALSLRISCDQTRVQVDQEIRCHVHAERIGFRGYGMLLAEIGLPPGAVVDRGSLEKAMQEAGWDISQYEVRPDRLVVYLWAKAGGTDFEFAFRGRYEMNALTAPSLLYDYYNPDAQTVVLPVRFEIEGTSVTRDSSKAATP